MNQLEPELLTVLELFYTQEAHYTVPIYQRNYAWQVEHIEQLLDDIQDAIRDKKNNYFLGNLMVTKRQSGNEAPEYEVIDGQQRLTTLYLLLVELTKKDCLNRLRHRLNRLQYESRPRATEALARITRESSHSAASPTSEQNTEDAGIHQGCNIIQQYLNQHLKDAESKHTFTEFLLDKVTVVRASLPADTDFNRYFEIMNTRGQQLQQVDIVKAKLMAHLDNTDERACFAWIWDACADMDTYVQMTLTPKEKKLCTTLRTDIFDHNWSFVVANGFDSLLASHQTYGSVHSGQNSSDNPLGLAEAITKYSGIGVAEPGEDEESVRFRSIIMFPAFLLHVLNVMRQDTEEDEGQLDDKALVKRFNDFLGKEGRDNALKVKQFAFELLRCRNLFDSYIIKRQYTATNSDDGDWSLQILFKRETAVSYKNTYSSAIKGDEDGVVDETTNAIDVAIDATRDLHLTASDALDYQAAEAAS